MRLLLLVVPLLAVVLTGCEASTASMSCAELHNEFVEERDHADRSCQTADDCMFLGGTGSCNCAPSVGSCNGDSVPRIGSDRLVDLARAFSERCMFSCNEEGVPCTCDCAPARSMCVEGTCQARVLDSCFPGQDAGVD